jgi:hypothetical protein
MIDAVFADIARKIRFRLVSISNDICIGIGKQPYLRKGLVAIAENSDLPSLNPEERGEGRKAIARSGKIVFVVHRVFILHCGARLKKQKFKPFRHLDFYFSNTPVFEEN